MKKAELKSVRGKSKEELIKLVDDKRTQIQKSSAEISAGKEKNLKKSSGLRRDVAQLLTLIKQAEITAAEAKEAEITAAETKEGKIQK